MDEDEPGLAALAMMLDKAGYEAIAFASVRDALAAIEADPDSVDLLLSDSRMPEMDDLETGNIRELESTIQRSIVLATGDEILLSELPASVRA